MNCVVKLELLEKTEIDYIKVIDNIKKKKKNINT